MRNGKILLPLAAFVVLLPLYLGGWTCGVDLPFHTQSWIDAAAQFRHGVLYPRWMFAAAYNAGEPRFTFYPPLSWMLSGLLTLVLPITAVSKVFAWIVLSVAGWTMYRLVAPLTSPAAGLFAGCVYLANPFMLYTVAWRGACGELFAAAWCPLLFAAMLEERPRAWRVAVPIGLLWLSNVPGAVIGMYLFALLAIFRLGMERFSGDPSLDEAQERSRAQRVWQLAGAFLGGATLGVALAGVFLVPALAERSWIRMEDAYPPGMRVIDNLLFQRRLDPVRDYFLLHIEHIWLSMLAVTAVAIVLAWRLASGTGQQRLKAKVLAPALAGAVAVSIMMTAPSSALWNALPALWVTQLPWRILFVLGCCMALAAGCLVSELGLKSQVVAASSLAVVLSMGVIACVYRRTGDGSDQPAAIAASMQRHHVAEPTDEYVLADADAEYMRPDNPPYWLTRDPQAFAPGTTPNTTHDDPKAEMPAVPHDAHLSATPMHFTVDSPERGFLVINLQDYPKWRVVLNDGPVLQFEHRQDGLLAFAVPAGAAKVEIAWRHTADEGVGAGLSVAALVVVLLYALRTEGSARRSGEVKRRAVFA